MTRRGFRVAPPEVVDDDDEQDFMDINGYEAPGLITPQLDG